MTAQNPAIFMQVGSTPAEDTRRYIGFLVQDTAVRDTAGSMLVTATTGLTVSVAGGRLFVPGTDATYQGTYMVENRGAATLTHDPADASLDRIDLVVARIVDSVYLGGIVNLWKLDIVKGTNAAPGSAAAPALPASCVSLSQVSVTHGLATITSGQLTDTRPAAYVQWRPSTVVALRLDTSVLTINTSTTTPILYDGGVTTVGPDITFAGGIATIHTDGIYDLDASTEWPLSSGVAAAFFVVNGADTVNGRDAVAMSTAHRIDANPHCKVPLTAGTTVQVGLQSLDGSVTNVMVRSFTIDRRA